MKQFVVYTVMVGGYDNVEQPSVVDERFDYVLFTDSVEREQVGVWQIRSIPFWNENPTRFSRYPKMHPEELLSEYDASLYIDANIQIADRRVYERFIALYDEGIDWGGVKHPNPPFSGCIYDHAFVVLSNGLDTERTVFRWCHKLRKEGYPKNNGLFENNVIYRRNNEVCRQVDAMWWKMYCDYSRRDQLSLFYVFWKHPSLSYGLFLPEGERAINSELFNYGVHRTTAPKTRSIKQDFFQHARSRLRSGVDIKRRIKWNVFHYRLYALPVPIALAIVYVWGVLATMVYGPIVKYYAYKRHKIQK